LDLPDWYHICPSWTQWLWRQWNTGAMTLLVPSKLRSTLINQTSIGPQNLMRIRLLEESTARAVLENSEVKRHAALFEPLWRQKIAALTLWAVREHTKLNTQLFIPFSHSQQPLINSSADYLSTYGQKKPPFSLNPMWITGLALGSLGVLTWIVSRTSGKLLVPKEGSFNPVDRLADGLLESLSSKVVATVQETAYHARAQLLNGAKALFNTGLWALPKFLINDFRLRLKFQRQMWPHELKGWTGFLIGAEVYYPLAAPFVEETIKRAHPSIMWGLPFMELTFNVLTLGWPLSLPAFVMHCVANYLPIRSAMCLHAVFNWSLFALRHQAFKEMDKKFDLSYASWPVFMSLLGLAYLGYKWWTHNPSKFAEHVDYYHNSPWPQRKLDLNCPIEASAFPSSESAVANSTTSYLVNNKPRDALLPVTGWLTTWGQKEPASVTYYFLPTSLPLYRPSHTNANMIAVVENRILVPAPGPSGKDERWSLARHIIPHIVPQHTMPPYDALVSQWVEKFTGRQRAKYERALKDMIELGPLWFDKKARYTKLTVKADECLIRATGTQLELKPRSIAVVDEAVQIVTGPHVYAAQEKLKHLWSLDSAPIAFNGHWFCLYFACGWSDKQLNLWYQRVLAHSDLFHILVSGDDSLVWNPRAKQFIEGDLSMCDQSQGFGALSFQKIFLRRLGVPVGISRILEDLTSVPYMVFGKPDGQRIKISRKDRPMRDTGGVDTTIGNSIFCAIGLLLKHSSVCEYLDLGMDMKTRTHDSIFSATFLKGMWYSTVEGPYWGPLPSRFVKVGKSWRNPRELYPDLSFEAAARQFLVDLSQGYSSFLLPPVMRQFAENFRGPMRRDLLAMEWQNVVAFKEAKPALTMDVWIWLHKRYGLTEDQFREMEALIPTEPFVFLSHPGFIRLGLVDYS